MSRDLLKKAAYMKSYNKWWRERNPERHAYHAHKITAKQRGIDFLLTFEEWRGIWGDKLQSRGRGLDNFCMARIGDTGPYAVDNVQIKTMRENLVERWQ